MSDNSLAPRSLAAAVQQLSGKKTSKMFGKDDANDPTNPFHLVRRRQKAHEIIERIQSGIKEIEKSEDAAHSMAVAQAMNLYGLVGILESLLIIADSLSIDIEEDKGKFSRTTAAQLLDDLVNGFEVEGENGEEAEIPGLPLLAARIEHAAGSMVAISSIQMNMINDCGKHYEVFYSDARGGGRVPDPKKYDRIIQGEASDMDTAPSKSAQRRSNRGMTIEQIEAARNAGKSEVGG